MPPQLLFNISSIDLTRVVFDQEAIRAHNPQRGDMEHLNGIAWVDVAMNRGIGFKDVRADEFWVAGHIPGRPLLPGVLMVEAAAQLASFYTKQFLNYKGFIGFAGVEEVKFRQSVSPGCRMFILLEKVSERHRRVQCRVQGVVNGTLVFEGGVTGVEM